MNEVESSREEEAGKEKWGREEEEREMNPTFQTKDP